MSFNFPQLDLSARQSCVHVLVQLLSDGGSLGFFKLQPWFDEPKGDESAL